MLTEKSNSPVGVRGVLYVGAKHENGGNSFCLPSNCLWLIYRYDYTIISLNEGARSFNQESNRSSVFLRQKNFDPTKCDPLKL